MRTARKKVPAGRVWVWGEGQPSSERVGQEVLRVLIRGPVSHSHQCHSQAPSE